jgi:hypothetical protein
MRHRSFRDRNGVRWTVAEITKGLPTFAEQRERRDEPRLKDRQRVTAQSALEVRPFDAPWLSFESKRERRRLASVPARWDSMAEDELEDLLGESEAISNR